ncbi:MAG: DUF2029 domain-containing protein [Candidatus Omnitrophica bacterium]|nr:DUF2029 domain-containing protein [Candidatus Omnitrophota bacterium]
MPRNNSSQDSLPQSVPGKKLSKWLWVVWALILCAFIGNAVRYSGRAPKRHYSDFRVYYATGERFLQKENIYSRPDMSITPFKYSPTFAMLFAPLSRLSKHHAALVFFSVNFLSVVVICYLSKKIIGPDALPFAKRVGLFFLSILFSSRFILLVWDAGQVNLIMLLLTLLSLYLLSRKQEMLSATALGLGVLIKYMPAVFVPYFFIRKKWKWTLYVGLAVLALLLSPGFVVGFEQGIGYLQKWLPYITETSLDKSSWYDYKNQSIFSMGLRFLTQNSPYSHSFLALSHGQAMFVSILFALGLYVLILWPVTGKKYSQAIDYSLLLLCMALFNPNAWMLNFVPFIFVYIFLWQYLFENQFKDKVTLIFIVVSFMMTSWLSETVVSEQLESLAEELSCVTLGTLVLVAALLRLKYSRTLALK